MWTKGPVVIVDGNNIAWRSFHAMRGTDLSVGGVKTGMMYQVMMTICQIHERWQTTKLIWCFDGPESIRKRLSSDYKANRKPTDDQTAAMRTEAYAQIDRLRLEVLPALGYRNIFHTEGYEADDLIARAAQNYDEVVIVSNDQDLYQVLSETTKIWNLKEVKTLEWYTSTFKLLPNEWIQVKAIAGCSSDNIIGVRGVGEQTAVKFLQGNLGGKKADAIVEFIKTDQYKLNRRLVKLPLKGCPEFEQVGNILTNRRWAEVCGQWRMDSLRHRNYGL